MKKVSSIVMQGKRKLCEWTKRGFENWTLSAAKFKPKSIHFLKNIKKLAKNDNLHNRFDTKFNKKLFFSVINDVKLKIAWCIDTKTRVKKKKKEIT